MPASRDSSNPNASATSGATQQSLIPSALARRTSNSGDPAPESPEAGGGGGGGGGGGSAGPGPSGGMDFVPSVSLPKGGGALRSIGEKFETSSFTGTAGMSVPIFTSPGRALSPGLGVSYNSGAGNGAFGLGWQLSAPMISRKTDEGLPEYNDAENSDVFVLSDAEDLVPMLEQVGDTWKAVEPRIEDDTYIVHTYRPRVEGGFARIERWVNKESGVAHWHTWTADNMRAVYGVSESARVFDPQRPERVYCWKLEAKTDDRGNAIVFKYKAEDFQSTSTDPRDAQTQIHDSQRYLKRIFYGRASMMEMPEDSSDPNADPPQPKTPLTPDPKTLLIDEDGDPMAEVPTDWHFEVVFDYGEHTGDGREESVAWDDRPDPFSNYRPGFEVRTHRLCRRVMMFHRFGDELNAGASTLVRSTEFYYRPLDIDAQLPGPLAIDWTPDMSEASNRVAVQMHGVIQRAYRDGDDDIFPPVQFQYSQASIDDTMHNLPESTLDNLPSGVDGQSYRFVDVDGEGLPGILSEMNGEWYYKEPLGEGRFGAVKTLPSLPRHARLSGGSQFVDLDGDGQKSLVDYSGPTPGFIERYGVEGDWRSFQPFQGVPHVNISDPYVQLIDLNGDGFADIIVDDDDRYVWYPSKSKSGFEAPRIVPKPRGQDLGPQRVYGSLRELVSFADMTGDGLQDIVRITREQVEYWPSLGHGRFGGRVILSQEIFDDAKRFQVDKVRLGDIDGSGPTDIIYMDNDGVSVYFNEAGNELRAARRLSHFPPVDQVSRAQLVDLFGNGTACLVYSTASPHARGRQLSYLRLMAEGKPYLLQEVDNGVGGRTRVQYGTSVQHYLRDKLAGTPWMTRLAFPVQVVDKVEVHDAIAQRRFTQRYTYHHGYYDGLDREFRGFGRVEQFDTEDFGIESLFEDEDDGQGTQTAPEYMPPVRSVTWFHLGASLQRSAISQQFAAEYFREGDFQDEDRPQLGDSVLVGQIKDRDQEDDEDDIVRISGQNIAEAYRSLRGRPLRVEVYADDAALERFDFDDNLEDPPETPVDRVLRAKLPYSVTETNFSVYQIQPRHAGQHGVFLATDRETLARQYERGWTDDANERFDPRTSHAMVLDVDRHGVPLQTLAIGYGRRVAHSASSDDDHPERRTAFVYGETDIFDHDDRVVHRDFRLSIPACASSYELVGDWSSVGLGTSDDTTLFQLTEGFAAALKSADIVHHNDDGSGVGPSKRLLSRQHSIYYNEDDPLVANAVPLDLGEAGPRAIVHHRRSAVMSLEVAKETWEDEGLVSDAEAMMLEAGYMELSGLPLDQVKDEFDRQLWWAPSARQLPNVGKFYLSTAAIDPLNGELYTLEYDAFSLFVTTTTDPFGNTNEAEYDYVALAPKKVTDANGTTSEVRFDTRALVECMFVAGDNGEGTVGDDFDDPTVEYAYNLEAWYRPAPGETSGPVSVKVTTRRRHVTPDILSSESVIRHSLEGEEDAHLVSVTYSDGSGGVILEKVQAEENGPGWQVNGDGEFELVDSIADRWVGNGRRIVDNKGNPVRQYEPYFVEGLQFDSEPALVQSGVSPELIYDAAGRNTKTIFPNGSIAKVRFSPWRTETYDPNDLIESADPDNTWWTDVQANFNPGDPQYDVGDRARAHGNTPSISYLDSLGRGYRSEQSDGSVAIETTTNFDVEGNVLAVTSLDVRRKDLSGNDLPSGQDIVASENTYAMGGFPRTSTSRDAGPTWALANIVGNPVYMWDRRDDLAIRDGDPPDPNLLRTRRMTYDRMQRPVDHYLQVGSDDELLLERLVYGETRATEAGQAGPTRDANQLGRVYRVYDGAGVSTIARYDFKGSPVGQSRTLARLPADLTTDPNPTPDWSVLVPHATIAAMETAAAPKLEDSADLDHEFEARSHNDALGRVLAAVSPDGSTTSYAYNRAGLLEAIEVTHVHDDQARSVVQSIDYNERGQRLKIVYGEGEGVPERRGTTTDYRYEATTFRLVGIHSYLNTPANINTAPAPTDSLQYLEYTFDPVGNIAHLVDVAVDTVFFNNLAVEPEHVYTYDALYRLTKATGREHVSQGSTAPGKQGHHTPQPLPSDGGALRPYTQDYVYDKLGNFLTMAHTAHGGSGDNWTRHYAYEDGSNRLTETKIQSESASTSYEHNVHGQMTAMPGQAVMAWNGKDELAVTSTGPGTAVQGYTYGLDGQRVRKVEHRPGSASRHERIYLGGFEILRRFNGSGLNEAIETLHVSDDMGRVCIVESKTHDADTGAVTEPVPKWRFQLGNHLGSASMEISEDGTPISFEEYHPYGTTALSSPESWSDVSAKRYRYTGKERDEETGLYYHGARYYAPWLGRWTASDPIGLGDGLNRFAYVRANPVGFLDSSGNAAVAAAVLIYLGWKALESGIETGVEAGIAKAMDDESFSPGVSFAKNFAVNSTIGIIPGATEAKIGAKTAVYTAKLGGRVAADSLADTVTKGGDFTDHLAGNTLANVVGDAGGQLVKKGVDKLRSASGGAIEEATESVTESVIDSGAEQVKKKASTPAASNPSSPSAEPKKSGSPQEPSKTSATEDTVPSAKNPFPPDPPDVDKVGSTATRSTGATRGIAAWDFDAAEAAYAAIRNTDDVAAIAKNTGWSQAWVSRAKNHLFNATHQLDDGVARFDAHPEIANAWHRLQAGTHGAKDIQLLRHELFESRFEGIFQTTYRTAHDAANRAGRWSGIE